MSTFTSKLLGMICLLGSARIFYMASQGMAAGGVVAVARPLGASLTTMWLASLVLGAVAVGFGLRALLWNRVCLGDHCALDSAHCGPD